MNTAGSSDEALLRQKLAKAESEALKATNERLAAEKRGQTIKEELEGKLSDLQDEVNLRDSHVQALEREKQELFMALGPLGVHGREGNEQLKNHLRDVASQQAEAREVQSLLLEVTASKTASSSKVTLRDVALSARSQLQSLTALSEEQKLMIKSTQEHRDGLHEEMTRMTQVESSLQRRERELVAAKRRLKKLSSTLRKTVPGWINANVSMMASGNGDATLLTVGQADETVGGESLNHSRDFDSDMLDEMEQLVTFVEDLDHRLEFQKVEVDVQRKSLEDRLASLVADNDALQAHKAEAQAQLASQNETMEALKAEITSTREQHEAEVAAQIESMHRMEAQIQEGNSKIASLELDLDERSTRCDELVTDIEELRAANAASEFEAKTQADHKIEELERLSIAAQEDLESRLLRQMDETDSIAKAHAEILRVLEDERTGYEKESAKFEEALHALEGDKEGLQCILEREQSARVVLQEEVKEMKREALVKAEEIARLNKSLEAAQEQHEALQNEVALQASLSAEKISAYDRLATHLYSALMEENRDGRESMADVSTHLQAAITTTTLQMREAEKAVEQAHSSSSEAITELQLESETLRSKVRALTEEATSSRIDLDQERTNRKLAEDALKQYVSSRDTDVTVAHDRNESMSRSVSDTSLQEEVATESETTSTAASSDPKHQAEEGKRMLALRETELENHIRDLTDIRRQLEEKLGDLTDQLASYSQRCSALELRCKDAEDAKERSAEESGQNILQLSEQLQQQMKMVKQLQDEVRALKEERESSAVHGTKDTASQAATVNDANDSPQRQLEDAEAETQRLRARLSEEAKQQIEVETALQCANTEVKRVSDERAELQQDLKSVTYALAKAQREAKKTQEESATIKTRVLDLEASMRSALLDQEEKALAAEALRKEMQTRLDQAEETATKLKAEKDTLQTLLDTVRKEQQERADSDSSGDKVEDLNAELAQAKQLIQDLEHELAVKAQECEDADDKELALRKDNKRLMSKLAALQSKVNKAQTSATQKQVSATDAAASDDRPATDTSPIAPSQTSTRKRSSPDDDNLDIVSQPRPAAMTDSSRAVVYAPAPSGLSVPATIGASDLAGDGNTSTRKQGRRSVTFDSPNTNRSRTHSSQSSHTPSSQRKRRPRVSRESAASSASSPSKAGESTLLGTSHNPSNLIHQRMHAKVATLGLKGNDAVGSASPNASAKFRDRTNQPRNQEPKSDDAVLVKEMSTLATSDKSAQHRQTDFSDVNSRQNNPFMAKLHRFKPQQA